MTRLPHVDRNDAGVTLIELVISVMILGIVIVAIFGAMNALTTTDRRAHERVTAQESIRQSLTEVARDLRSAQLVDVPASTVAARSAVALTTASGDHIRWRFDAAAKRLIREKETPIGSGTWLATRTVANVRNGEDGTDFLRYYGAGNQRLDANSTVIPSDLASCTLRIRLALKVAPADVATPYAATMDVGMRNRGSRGVSSC